MYRVEILYHVHAPGLAHYVPTRRYETLRAAYVDGRHQARRLSRNAIDPYAIWLIYDESLDSPYPGRVQASYDWRRNRDHISHKRKQNA
jgi:hypothetical protein